MAWKNEPQISYFAPVPNTNNNLNIDNFVHNIPRNQYRELVTDFGYPNFVRNEPNGAAIWLNKDIFKKIILADETIKHYEPMMHDDFLSTVVDLHIPDYLLCDIITLDKSISYDQLKNELTVRCGYIGANVATLVTILRIIDDPDNISHYKNQYDDIMKLLLMDKNSYHMLYDEMRQRLSANQKIYRLVN